MRRNIKPAPPADAPDKRSGPRKSMSAQCPAVIYRRMPSPDFPHLLRALRKQANLSELDVAVGVGETLSEYNEVEAGQRWPTGDPDQLDKLSRLLKLSAATRDQLFRAAGLVPPELIQVLFVLDLVGICRRAADAKLIET
jgi:transcriptional regulator with XRE-family HTH domain